MPSSAGAHTPGIEKAPAALRTAGLVSTLGADDHGDLSVRRWRPDRDHPNGQNPDVVAQVAAETAAAVATVAATGQTPLVLGGDCSITVGAVAGLLRDGGELTLLYMDGGPDLYTPETRANGNFDAMGVAHLLRLPGHVPGVAPVSLTPDRVVSYGHRMPPDDHESVLLDRLGIAGVHARDINRDPDAAAARALDLVNERVVEVAGIEPNSRAAVPAALRCRRAGLQADADRGRAGLRGRARRRAEPGGDGGEPGRLRRRPAPGRPGADRGQPRPCAGAGDARRVRGPGRGRPRRLGGCPARRVVSGMSDSDGLGQVVVNRAMSLDGFIAGPGHAMDWIFEYLTNESFPEVMPATGAMLVGRGTHEVARRMAHQEEHDYDGGPVFVLTHHPPDEPVDGVTFLTCGLAEAVATARAAGGGRNLEILGADLASQCLRQGLVDEVLVYVLPVLLGDGVRFSTSDLGRIDLEPFGNTQSGPVTMLRFRVQK